ncbi:DUF1643 domain-containing protein [Vibrio breoganii]|uniref:DUF1643 domain-containing protein n=1 Tax=Vibrio breoganii TaxID=553239 RepID=UPI000C850205|nr:DUF1643 domain-containing protein [Vibrio breoganii]PMK45980.1 hypothetical protein BCU00_07760 [Vibrio breoganii]
MQDLQTDFDIWGEFYTASGVKCRRYLDIKNKLSKRICPDLMVVMMNPGSSQPLDGNESNHKPSITKPDETQRQIAEVMRKATFSYARVLNLSDYRTPCSAELYRFIESEKSLTFPHSIFSPQRKAELSQLFVQEVPVIYAWGVDPRLEAFARMAIQAIDHPSPVGLLKMGTQSAYYHPLPRDKSKQTNWVNQIADMLSTKTLSSNKCRFFYAKASFNTWPKLFVLSKDGLLYSKYLYYGESLIFREQHNYLTFDASSFKWRGYQSIVEIDLQTALDTQLVNQNNWVSDYLDSS